MAELTQPCADEDPSTASMISANQAHVDESEESRLGWLRPAQSQPAMRNDDFSEGEPAGPARAIQLSLSPTLKPDRPVGRLLGSVLTGTNAEVIAAIAPLYLHGHSVIDMTWGQGLWWTRYRPTELIVHHSGAGPGGHNITHPVRTRRHHSYLLIFDARVSPAQPPAPPTHPTYEIGSERNTAAHIEAGGAR